MVVLGGARPARPECGPRAVGVGGAPCVCSGHMLGGRTEPDPSACLLLNWTGVGSQGNGSLKLKMGSMIIIEGFIV